MHKKRVSKNYFWGSFKLLQAHKKVCDKKTKKKTMRVKMLLTEGEGVYREHVDNSCHGFQQALSLSVIDAMKVPFIW